MSENIDSMLDAAEQREASDVFLQEDEIPRLKINEQITVFGDEPLSLAQMAAFWQACGANPQSDEMDRDTGFVSRTRTRYRVSLHRTMGRLGRACAVSRPRCLACKRWEGPRGPPPRGCPPG